MTSGQDAGSTGRAVAITGASGFVGQRLLAHLDRSRELGRLVGLDVRDPERRVRHLDFHRVDIAHAELKPMLDGIDVLVHLAAIHDPIPDVDLMARVNVGGTRRVLDAAAAVGVDRVVLMSSATVYGAWANNPVPLTENEPLRPNSGFDPAVQSAEVERLLAEWCAAHPGVGVVVLRPAPILGRGAQHLMARVLAGAPVAVRGASSPVQCSHVDDVADALTRACTADMSGVYNVACDGWLDAADANELRVRRLRPSLPQELAARALAAGWTSGLGDIPPGVVPLITHPWVVANDRLRATGWEPSASNEDALLATADSLATPPVWPWVVAGTATVAAAVLAEEVLRRRRRRGRA